MSSGVDFRSRVHRRVPCRLFLSRCFWRQPPCVHVVRRRLDLWWGARGEFMCRAMSSGLLLSDKRHNRGVQRGYIQCIKWCEQRGYMPPVHCRNRILLQPGEHVTRGCRLSAIVLLRWRQGRQVVYFVCLWMPVVPQRVLLSPRLCTHSVCLGHICFEHDCELAGELPFMCSCARLVLRSCLYDCCWSALSCRFCMQRGHRHSSALRLLPGLQLCTWYRSSRVGVHR